MIKVSVCQKHKTNFTFVCIHECGFRKILKYTYIQGKARNTQSYGIFNTFYKISRQNINKHA